MIRLRRLNGMPFFLNFDLIKTVEATPDTLITLSTGEKLLVLDPVDDVVQSTMECRKRAAQEPPAGRESEQEPPAARESVTEPLGTWT
jgi:flagellar protein FlbD